MVNVLFTIEAALDINYESHVSVAWLGNQKEGRGFSRSFSNSGWFSFYKAVNTTNKEYRLDNER